MKLTDNDKLYLAQQGYSVEDIAQIVEAAKSSNTYYYKEEEHKHSERVTGTVAALLLGRPAYLSGLARSAFHATAMQPCLDGKSCISFDSYRYFKKK